MSSKRNKRPELTTNRPKLAPVPQAKTEVLSVKAEPLSGYFPLATERYARLVVTTNEGVYLGLIMNEDLQVMTDEDLEYDDDEVAEFDSDAEEAREEMLSTCSTVDGKPLDLDGDLALRILVVAQRALASLRTRALERADAGREDDAVVVNVAPLAVAPAAPEEPTPDAV